MTLKKSLITAAAAGSIFLYALTPLAYADTTIQVTGNGASSDNTAAVTTTNTNTVKQDNSATVNNNVTSNTNTGGNSANDNTGGNVNVHTGSSNQTTTVSTAANLNQASTSNCNCQSSTDVTIAGNGAHSDNSAGVSQSNTQTVFQTNSANVNNNVSTKSNTGDNHASDNTGGTTGGGSVSITTGPSTQHTTVDTMANANVVTPSSAGAGSIGGSVSARILGNGAYSDNAIALGVSNSATVVQDNTAHINNNVHSDANTGKNSADDNTGDGGVSISTGLSSQTTDVSNLANFNSADLDCGCLMNVLAKVADNGAHSDNAIEAELGNDNSMFQTNGAALNNNVDPYANTGKNYAADNTSDPMSLGDPSVTTGPSDSTTSVSNAANQNWAGNGAPSLTLPGGGSMSFSFDMSMFSSFLHFLGL